jgi:hypothetical protein
VNSPRLVNFSTVGFWLLQMAKLVSIISLLLFGSALVVSATQDPGAAPSNADKAAIIESVLDLELVSQLPPFSNVSSENIQFMSPSQVSKHGFTLVADGQLREWQESDVERYLVFKRFSMRDGVVVIALSRITAGTGCFSGRFYNELIYTYEARQTPDGWVAQLTRRPMPDFFTARKLLHGTR